MRTTSIQRGKTRTHTVRNSSHFPPQVFTFKRDSRYAGSEKAMEQGEVLNRQYGQG